jgi:glycosyltransferase involved in cell wall biosynthesis
VGRTRYDLPLSQGLERKWDAVESLLEFEVVGRAGSGQGSDPRFQLVGESGGRLNDATSYAGFWRAVARALRRFRPDVVIAQSPFEALAVLAARGGRSGSRPKLLVELHGDWRTAARLYGSRSRRLLAPLADRVAVFAMRRADGIRAVSPRMADLAERATGRRPLATFPAFIDLEVFSSAHLEALPSTPAVAWVGVLERPKDPRLLAEAWRVVAPRVPGARLVVVGQGSLRPVIDDLAQDLPERVQALSWLEPSGVSRLLDASTVLAISSRSEGSPRVIMEAFLRGRPVVSRAVGGVPDLVVSERNGLLVDGGDPNEFAAALVRVLTDRGLAERLARGARETAQRAEWSPAGYAEALRAMVDRALDES